MENIMKLLSDIFSMKFDVLMPISGCIVACFLAFILFSVRYFSYCQKQKKYAKVEQTVIPQKVTNKKVKSDAFSDEMKTKMQNKPA